MKKITVLLFMMISIIQPQTIKKVVQFTDSETIDIVTESENYIGVTISVNSFQALPRAILFNKNGDIVFEIEDPERSEFIIAEPVESLGYFITVRRGGGKVLDQIRAFSLNTGEKVWETEANACAYELSPNKKFMITVGDPGTERTGIFEIINLKDGSKVDFGYNYNKYCAAWLDEERIVFVFQEWEKNELGNVQQDTVQDFKIQNSKIKSELFQNENFLKKGLITQSEYDKRKKELNEQKAKLEKTIPKLTKSEGGRILHPSIQSSPKPKTIKLVIYDMKNNEIDQEKYLYKGDGGKIHIGPFPNASKTINVDKDKNIYIYGYDTFENNRQYYLVKFSKDLNFIWTTKMGIGDITRFSTDSSIYFRSKSADNVTMIDINTGNLISLDEFKMKNPNFKNIDISYNYRRSKVKIESTCIIDHPNKTILFKEGD